MPFFGKQKFFGMIMQVTLSKTTKEKKRSLELVGLAHPPYSTDKHIHISIRSCKVYVAHDK